MRRKSLKSKIYERYDSQSDFAAALGRNDAHVSRVVMGRKGLNADEAQRWSALLGVDVGQLLQ